jgi:hypothetical protein
MTPRPHARTRRAALSGLLAGATLLSLPGCDPRTLIYFLQPFEPTVPATGPSLKGKKVVVLTNVDPGQGMDYDNLGRQLTREFVKILRKDVKKITVVDPDKVAAWEEAHPKWTDPSEAAKAFEADMAILLDIGEFRVEDPRSPGLLEGVSSVHIQAWEIAHPKNSKGKEIKSQPKEPSMTFEDTCDTQFPTRGPVALGPGVSRSSFRLKFLTLVATEVSWRFIDHEPGDDIQDVKFAPNSSQ